MPSMNPLAPARLPSYYQPTRPGQRSRLPRFAAQAVGPSRKIAGLTAHSGLAAGEHTRRACAAGIGDDADGETDPPGYRNPTPQEIWERRIEVHRLRGEPEVAAHLQSLGPPDASQWERLDEDEADCPGLTPLSLLGLRRRTVEALEGRGIFLAGELPGFTEAMLRRIPNVGNVTIVEIRTVLAKLGLTLRDDRSSVRQPLSPRRIGA